MITRILLLFCLLITINLTAQIPTDGLVSHYPLDGNGIDLTSNTNNGEFVGGITYAEDRFGVAHGAIEFNGQDGYVNVLNDSSLDFTEEMSICVWIKVANLSNLNFIALVNKWEDAPGGGLGYYLGINNNAFEIRWNTGSAFSDGSPIIQNEWIHLVVTYSASDMIIYRNGVVDISIAGGGPISSSNVDLRFGQQSEIFGNSLFYSGLMDQVLLYDRALTFDEVVQIYGNDPTSVTNNFLESDIEIYPNPFNDFVRIKSDAFPKGNIMGEFFDVNGRLVQQFSVNSFNQNVSTVNLEKGIYMFIIRNDEGILKREKVIKM